jgi:glycosyltransferase involved in cell wall biosynthesis
LKENKMTDRPLEEKRILILVLHDMSFDTRVQKEGEVLNKAGAQTLTLAVHNKNMPLLQGASGNYLRRIKLLSKDWSKRRLVQLFKYFEFLLKATVIGVRFRPHAVHANDWDSLLTGWIIARLSRAALVYDSHEYWWDSAGAANYPTPLRKIQRHIERVYGRRADRLVSISQTLLTAVQTRIPNSRGHVVYNSWLAPPPDGLTAKGWTGKCPLRLLYLGALQPGRGLEALVQGVQRIQGVELDIYGYDKMHLNLHEKLDPDAAGGKVRLLTPVPPEQVHAIARKYHLGVLPYGAQTESRNLALPNKLFEYAGSGLGLLSAPNRGLREWIDRFEAGIYFEADNTDNLVEVLQSILRQPERVAIWQTGALKIASEVNSVTAETGLIDLYRGLLTGDD